MRKFSELEGVCLGLVHHLQPCTAYSVRRALKSSPSTHWQASAGAVYPALARLGDAGLILTKKDQGDGRGRKLLKASASGRNALRQWIHAGNDRKLISAIMDPIRSRMFFLDVLSKQQQVFYLEQMISLTEEYLEETRKRLEKSPETENQYGYLGALGATMITQTRLDWLKLVRKKIKSTDTH